MTVPTLDDELPVDAWYVAPTALGVHQLTGCNAVLSDDERASVRRFVAEPNQRERLVARALVRHVLSRYRDVAPTSWQFRAAKWGKPEIDPPCELRFNLAHHPTMVVCVVTQGPEVGVDVEPLSRHGQIAGVAKEVFAPSELAEVAALTEAARGDRLVSLWTLKEAYIKARGMGLSLPLRQIAFRFDEYAPRLVASASVDPDSERWAFATTDVEGHRVAVALDARGATLRIQLRPYALQLPT